MTRSPCWVLRLMSVVVAALAVCHCLHAAGEADPRISLALDGAPLTKVMAVLSNEIKVKHTVTREGKLQHVVVYCEGRPVSEVRSALATLLGWNWSRHAVRGETSYLLAKPSALASEEDALRKRYTGQYVNFVEVLARAASAPDKVPRDNSPLSYQVHQPPTRGLLRGFQLLPPEIRGAVLNGKPYSRSAGQMPPVVATAVSGILADGNSGDGPSADRLRPGDTIRLEIVQERTGQPGSLQLTILRAGKVQRRINCAHAVVAESVGKLGGDGVQPGSGLRMPGTGRRQPATKADGSMLETLLQRMAPMKWPTPPTAQPSYIGWYLRDISRRMPLVVVADQYPQTEAEWISKSPELRPPWAPPDFSGKSLRTALDDVANRTGYDWRLEGGSVVARYPQWYWEARLIR